MTFQESKQGLARKLGIDIDKLGTNGLFTEADLNDYIIQGSIKAWDFSQWDFAEKTKTGTLTSTDITNGYVTYPPEISPLSIRLLTINGKEYSKIRFVDYKKYLEDNPTSDKKYWSEHNRLIFFNANSASAGQTIDLFGKEMLNELQNDGDLLPFSPETDNRQNSGNQAIILLAYAEALSSEKKKNHKQAELEEKKAYLLLSNIANQASYGRVIEGGRNRPQFNVPDFFSDSNSSAGSTGGFSSFNN